MSRRDPLPWSALIGAPLAMLLIGGGVGWFTRDTSSSGEGTASVATVVGATVPENVAQLAPYQRLTNAPNPVIIDPASIIGMPATSSAVDVPATAALDLPLVAGGSATVVDPVTHEAFAADAPEARQPADPTAVDALPPLATPEATLPPADDPTATTVASSNSPLFADPCVTADVACAGAPGDVLDANADNSTELDPLQISAPVSGANGFAAQCNAIEEGKVPDTLLTPATRPTVAVLVNQPSTLALTGEWADGTAVEKTTMVTSPADDAEWQRSWDEDRVQKHIVACLTLPLEQVRLHASAGVGSLRTDILAISATGRVEITGQVTLNIPTDGDDAFFAERLVIADRGEQQRTDGQLYPTVHVHYAFLTDTVAAAGSGLNPDATHVYGQHAFIEGADCNGWVANEQGRDRTENAALTVTSEQRSVAGRPRNVTIVDGDVYLDPSMPSGWEGQFCVRLIATDQPPGRPGAASPEPVTLALRGATLRAPQTAEYSISVLLDDPDFPADSTLRAVWATASGTVLCNEATISADNPGAACATSARFVLSGAWLEVRSVAANGTESFLLTATVPINTAYCNPDDPFGAGANGCSTGYTQTLEVPNTDGDNVRLQLQVDRTAAPGALWQDPAHAWIVGPITSFSA